VCPWPRVPAALAHLVVLHALSAALAQVGGTTPRASDKRTTTDTKEHELPLSVYPAGQFWMHDAPDAVYAERHAR
jgi:hypothetical protein